MGIVEYVYKDLRNRAKNNVPFAYKRLVEGFEERVLAGYYYPTRYLYYESELGKNWVGPTAHIRYLPNRKVPCSDAEGAVSLLEVKP